MGATPYSNRWQATISPSTATTTDLVASKASYRAGIDFLVISSDGAAVVSVGDEDAAGNIVANINFAAAGTVPVPFVRPLFGGSGKKLQVTTSNTAHVTVSAAGLYREG